MAWLPAVMLDVLNVATPALNIPVPSTAVPSVNVTIPVATPMPGGVARMVAVKVTACPAVEGFSDDFTAMLSDALDTVSTSAPEGALALKLPSPS